MPQCDSIAIIRTLLNKLRQGIDDGQLSDCRQQLTQLLTILSTSSFDGETWTLLDQLWTLERLQLFPVRAALLPRESGAWNWLKHISIWRGDITKLEVDAIVNAANSGLTGCYEPFHACVDNAIHTAAGPRLRQECEAIMANRGRPEPTATATLTNGYFLPAQHVIHTVGPIVRGGSPTSLDQAALCKTYRACLDAAANAHIADMAFCAISTGVFGYPKEAAAAVALDTTRAWLETNHDFLEQVVFVVFSETDEVIYRQVLSRMKA